MNSTVPIEYDDYSLSSETTDSLNRYDQFFLVEHYNSLPNDDNKKAFKASLEGVDYDDLFQNKLPSALNNDKSSDKSGFDPDTIRPFPMPVPDTNTNTNTNTNLKVAACIMAGGAGTRLGFPGPKGTFPVIRNKTLFDFLIPRCPSDLPVYIMTSPDNDEETQEFFRKR
mmetsp:Transcript_18150/g.37005  ORF Transcript_18150/g.37005 Transcript_18150/m.37005 type:complete len:169 (+) Transcript_18150:226-732(+)